jgi:AraC-like DNA-binding protein
MLMKRIFSKFLISHIILSTALLAILCVIYIYIFNISLNNSINESSAHLSMQLETFRNDLLRMSALAGATGNYNSIIKAASFKPPLTPVQRFALDQAKKDLENGVSALVLDMIFDYGIVFQNGTCITARRIFDSVDECFGVFLTAPGVTDGIWSVPAGLNGWGNYSTPEHENFMGLFFTGDMRLRYNVQQVNKVFFLLDTDTLLKNWAREDITRVELYMGGSCIGSYGSVDEKSSYHKIEYRSGGGIAGYAYIPEKKIQDKLKPAVSFMLASFVCFLLTGLGLSVYFSRKHSRPIQNIVSTLMAQTHVASLPANELLFIIHSIEQMRTSLEKTQDTLRERDRILHSFMFERLLGGLVYSSDEWEEARRLFGDLAEAYCLCLIQGGDGFANSLAHLSAQLVSERLPAPAMIHYTGGARAVVVLPIDGGCGESKQYGPLLGEVVEMMRIKYKLQIYIAVSGVFGSIEQLQVAYRQTRQLLRLAGAGVGKNIFFADDAEENQERFPLEFTDSQRFYELLLEADLEHASLMIKHAFGEFRNKGITAEQVLYHLFWSFEQVFIRFGAEIKPDKGIRFTMPVYSPQDSIDDLTEKLIASAAEICAAIRNSHNQSEMELSQKIIAYIDDTISNHMLNLSAVAEHFSLSERYVQNLLRSATAKSYFEYVDQRRMKMARVLLEESSLSVNDVAARCGYALSNSFYKSFKRHFGFPPTELRKGSE